MEPVKGGTLAKIPNEAENLFKQYHPDLSIPSWAIRYAASLDNVMVVLSGMSNMEQLKANIETYSTDEPLNENEFHTLTAMADEETKKGGLPCTACRYCTDGCPRQIAIPDLFAVMNTKQIYHDWNADFYYNNVYTGAGRRASDCIQCGRCEKACPQHLPIRRLLTEIAAEFEKQ